MLLEKQLCEATQMLEEKEKERMVLIEFSSAEIIKKEKEIENLKKRLSVSEFRCSWFPKVKKFLESVL